MTQKRKEEKENYQKNSGHYVPSETPKGSTPTSLGTMISFTITLEGIVRTWVIVNHCSGDFKDLGHCHSQQQK